MADSLKFGTSGLRGLAADLIGAPSARYASAYLAYLAGRNLLHAGAEVLVGRDLRESSPAIAGSVIAAIAGAGYRPVDCGDLSTPALALAAQTAAAPAIMVTGSHIPADRNGLKFYLSAGEITKADEAGILAALQQVGIASGWARARSLPAARRAYLARYREVFPAEALAGMRIGVFQHSSVLRDDLAALLASLGAEAVPLGRADHFVPIDTEALSAEVITSAKQWVGEQHLDALVSTDGDADRPLLADETGEFLRGDLLGILTAQFLGADAVVTPVTSNSAIENLQISRVVRTKVGSPHVIAGMEAAKADGARVVIGFEANGGTLLGTDATIGGHVLKALPTRDAVLPMLAVLSLARQKGLTVSGLAATLPARIARSDRLEQVPQERSAALLAELGAPERAARYFAPVGTIADVSDIDGLRFVLGTGEVIHYRASGNAPELRCYTEAETADRAEDLLVWGLAAAEKIVRN